MKVFDNPYNEAPDTRRPYRFFYRHFYGHGSFRWRLLPLSLRYDLIHAWDRYEKEPPFLQARWDKDKEEIYGPKYPSILKRLPDAPPAGYPDNPKWIWNFTTEGTNQ